MSKEEKIIEYLVRKYGYKKNTQPSVYATIVNRRIRKALKHLLLFWD